MILSEESATFRDHALFARMISLPLRAGDRRVGVLNVVASLPGVFDQAEFSYVESLASVVSVALGVWLQDQLKGADTKT